MPGVLLAAVLPLRPASTVARGVHALHATYFLPVRDGVGFFTVRLFHRTTPESPWFLKVWLTMLFHKPEP
jgi:hypothetical protein